MSFTRAQLDAVNPMQSAFVQANAGTGKTTVLTGRLLRILFSMESLDSTGVLCLTYTKAGAGEMRNRILREMRRLAMADDDTLAELVGQIISPRTVTSDDMRHARDIFYAYIDNPDILNVKTIHSFCEEILRRFPLEAGLSPAWTMATDSMQNILRRDAFLQMIRIAKSAGDGSPNIINAFDTILDIVSEDSRSFGRLMAMLGGQYKYFFGLNNYDNYRKYFVDTTKKFLNIQNPIVDEVDINSLQNIIAQAKNVKNPPNYIIDIITKTQQYIDKTIDFDNYKYAYLTRSEQTKIANVAKKDFLVAEQNRVYEIDQYNKRKNVFDNTIALFDLSAEFARVYQELKKQHDLLDFEDLILYTRNLFSNQETMGWVLSQMNTSINHILVDEAQDTSPDQWNIIVSLVHTIMSVPDYDTIPPTSFVVGDTKQSIFGFQGADPHAFSESRDVFEHQIEESRLIFKEPVLDVNYRSVAPILETVDEFFNVLPGFYNNTHKCSDKNKGVKGCVEVHNVVYADEDNGMNLSVYLDKIADEIAGLIQSGYARASDIMVLVRDRNPMAPIMVNKLKARNIQVAGSDRIQLPDFPVIRDLMHLVRFCIDTSNDYSLCCILKSPLFRLIERDIFNLCKIKNTENTARKQQSDNPTLMTVFDALESQHPDIYAYLTDVVKWASDLSAYSFFTRVLAHDDARTSMIAALGNQIVEPLEEFMTICLSYERTEPGTMRDFIKWFITGASEIKRDVNHADGARVITVHGSKGLQSKVVFMIDTAKMPKGDAIAPITTNTLAQHGITANAVMPPVWLWLTGVSQRDSFDESGPDACMQHVLQDAATARNAEYYRLLYVAMTRACERLYIYGFKSTKGVVSPDTWIAKLWDILSRDDTRFTDETKQVIRISND
ncbi:MAG: UvrD-helicase domain-containing protein [Muribaculaceae bacterium]|nr:UvrD-helicase domain-containing protein [Muribaculaceae bacterium]